MKRKNKIVAILSAIAVAIGVVAGAGALSARANAETWSVADLDAGNVYGETVDIPDRTVSIGENSTIALSTITYPSGKVTREKRVRLGEAGNWTVRYYAELDGKHYAKNETFFVEGRGYNVKSKNSSVEWSDYTDLGITSTGLLVRLANKDSLTFTGTYRRRRPFGFGSVRQRIYYSRSTRRTRLQQTYFYAHRRDRRFRLRKVRHKPQSIRHVGI